jgi:UDP-N-acetylmuramoylalanine-D-glutamate ligase
MTVPVILIAGGEGKAQDSPAAEPIRKRAKAVVLIGKDARFN